MKITQLNNVVAVTDFCINHNIEVSFIASLHQNGLIEITTINGAAFIDADQLQQLEKFVRFYYELDINVAGIETIAHLLARNNAMQHEIKMLTNKLSLYEDEQYTESNYEVILFP